MAEGPDSHPPKRTETPYLARVLPPVSSWKVVRTAPHGRDLPISERSQAQSHQRTRQGHTAGQADPHLTVSLQSAHSVCT